MPVQTSDSLKGQSLNVPIFEQVACFKYWHSNIGSQTSDLGSQRSPRCVFFRLPLKMFDYLIPLKFPVQPGDLAIRHLSITKSLRTGPLK